MLSEKWRITLLNRLEVTGNGQRISRFRGRTSAELLALLILNSHRFVPREEIAGTIWPDSTPEAGRAGLRTALASLRAQLEPPGTLANSVLLADRVAVRLSTDAFTSDVLDYIAASSEADSARSPEMRFEAALKAVDLYAGELLPGNYSEWVLAKREKLYQTYLTHLANIVSVYRASNQPTLALPFAQRLIDENPFDEDPYLLAMRLYLEARRQEDALRCFERLRQTLQTEFNTKPSATASELAHTARRMLEENPISAKTGQDQSTSTEHQQAKADSRYRDRGAGQDASSIAMPPISAGLPVPLTRFFGRDTDIMHIVRMICPDNNIGNAIPPLAPQRLITITGTGGTGKTRLASEIGAIFNSDRQMQVTFVPLADITDPGRILEGIARALKLVPLDSENLFDQIVSALSAKPHLLILDNMEQLLASLSESPIDRTSIEFEEDGFAPELVRSLLEHAKKLCCLVTSRQCLDVEGEQEYPLQPLATPAFPATPERLLDFASVKLFVDRAQLSRPEFQLTPRNADVVASICAKLDGLPLALELAAAWSSSLSPVQILERLSQRFALLVGRKRGRSTRHASLRAALEWSYHLLSSDQQRLFSRLSAFRGGWTVQAAEFVCEDPLALQTIASLRDRSLIVLDESPDDSEDLLRYRLLESLREYSAEQLTGEETIDVRRRHLGWYASWTNDANSSWSGTEQQVWLQRVQTEQENLHTALQFSLRDSNLTSVSFGMHIMANLGQYWSLRGNFTDTRELFTQFLDHPGTKYPDTWRARALLVAGGLAGFQEDWKAAESLFEESLIVSRECDSSLVGSAEIKLGDVAFVSGNLSKARQLYQNSLTSYVLAEKPAGVAAAYGALGLMAMTEEDYSSAIAYVLKAVELNRQMNNLSGVTHHLGQLGLCYAKADRNEEASASFAESLNGYRSLKDLRGMAELFVIIAEVFPISENSVCLLGAAQTINSAIAAMPKVNTQFTTHCQASLGEAAYESAWNRGRELSTDQAIEVADTILERSHALVP